MKSSKLLLIPAALSLVLLTGCATDPYYNNQGYNQAPPPAYSSNNSTPYYNNGNYQQNVRYGTVYSVRQVSLGTSQTSGAGIGIGAVAGGVIGNQIGGNAAGTVIGAIGGGLLGNEIEKRNYRQSPGLEVQVRIDRTGEIVTVVQPDQGQNFNNGARVRLVEQNGQWMATY